MEVRVATTLAEREAALRLLSYRLDPLAQAESVTETLHSAEQGHLNFEHLLIAQESGCVYGACWLVVADDLTGHLFAPEVARHEDEELTWQALAEGLVRRLELAGCWIGQILLHPDEVTQQQRLAASPFRYLADLQFMELKLEEWTLPDTEGTSPGRLETTIFQPGRYEKLFVETMQQTYVGSLDFPEVNAFRTAEEAFESHVTHSQIVRGGWLVFHHRRKPAGMLLLSPGQGSHWEITYMGVCPQARGQGIGRAMLEAGISLLKNREAQVLTLGVDSRNHYAISLYERYGFRMKSACRFYAWFPELSEAS